VQAEPPHTPAVKKKLGLHVNATEFDVHVAALLLNINNKLFINNINKNLPTISTSSCRIYKITCITAR
jgi:hypothetical protein